MSCKNLVLLFFLFIIFSVFVCFLPQITIFDTETIKYVQNMLSGVNREIPIAAGGILFYLINCVPIGVGCFYFFIKKMYKNVILYAALPFITYFINGIIKLIIKRPRPPLELQFEEHMSSFSYVSRHTFITACIWGIFIYIVCKYSKNKLIKCLLIFVSVVWILFEGFSRVWMGVHNPTDVIGALILAYIFTIFYINIMQLDRRTE